MKELPLKHRKSIDKYEPIQIEGLTLYPIRVEDYYEFLIAKQSLEFMTQTLPIGLMSLPILDAYFQMDSGQVKGYENPTGLFMSALLLLALALRLPGESIEDRLNQFQIVLKPDDQTRLKHIRFVRGGEEIVTITPIQFQKMRQILAEQNGIEMIDENQNPELIQAERDLAEKKAPKLEINIRNLISAAAVTMHVKEEEVYEWPILKLTDRLGAEKRKLDYLICGVGESQGTTWKHGNPCPHPWFDRKRTDSDAIIGLDKFAAGQGLAAVRDAMAARETQ